MQNVEQTTNVFAEIATLLNSIEASRDLRAKAAHDLEKALNRAADTIAHVFENEELDDCLGADFHEIYSEGRTTKDDGNYYETIYFERRRVFKSATESDYKPVLTIGKTIYWDVAPKSERKEITYTDAFTAHQDYDTEVKWLITSEGFDSAKLGDFVDYEAKTWKVDGFDNAGARIRLERFVPKEFVRPSRSEMVKIAKALPGYVKMLHHYAASTLEETIKAIQVIE